MKPDTDFEDLYQKNLNNHPAPSRIFRQVIQHVKDEQKNGSVIKIYKDWLPLACAASLVLCISLIVFNQTQLIEQAPNAQHLIEVELHGYQAETESQYAIKQQRYLQDYLSKQQSLDIAYTKVATIERTENEWQLRDCNQDLIKISEQLIAKLQRESRLTTNTSIGAQVQLTLNQQGFIISIQEQKTAMC